MKLLRYGGPGRERPGLLDQAGGVRDLSAHVPDIADDVLSPAGLDALRRIDPGTLPSVPPGTRLGPPVAVRKNFVCIGLNYADHAAETGAALPKEPVVFLKSLSALCGPTDPILVPRGSSKTDWETELAVVVGTRAKDVTEEDALAYVAGYAVCNDVSEREWQNERGGAWDKGKGFDTFGPLGPWLVTADEVPDPQALELYLHLDGTPMQRGSTGTMVFGVRALVSYVSRCITLHPGDVLSTGTPPGVGIGRKPPVFLRPGQRLVCGISGLGEQSHLVAAA